MHDQPPSSALEIKVNCNAAPLHTFIALLELATKTGKHTFDLGNLGSELTRVECSFGTTTARELLVCLYPSDAFLHFAATTLARDVDLGLIKESTHFLPSGD